MERSGEDGDHGEISICTVSTKFISARARGDCWGSGHVGGAMSGKRSCGRSYHVRGESGHVGRAIVWEDGEWSCEELSCGRRGGVMWEELLFGKRGVVIWEELLSGWRGSGHVGGGRGSEYYYCQFFQELERKKDVLVICHQV